MSAPVGTVGERVPVRDAMQVRTGVWAAGTPFVWLTGGTLAVALLMIAGLLGLVVVRGLAAFWPPPVAEVRLDDGSVLLGEVWAREEIPVPDAAEGVEARHRIQLRVGNRDFYGSDFRWVDEEKVESIAYPDPVVTIERLEWGNFYGRIAALEIDGRPVVEGGGAWAAVRERLPGAQALRRRIRDLERSEIGRVNATLEEARLERRVLERAGDATAARLSAVADRIERAEARYAELTEELRELSTAARSQVAVLEEVGGRTRELPLAEIVRAFAPNRLDFRERLGVYLSRLGEFVSSEPRESNTEGGIFPAIFGTFLMVVLMSLAVVPFGVFAAVYLHEYAKQGPVVRTVRIAVNNLAGVPSIVFGVFGLGFFIYFLGGSIDQLFYADRLPAPTFGTGGILWASLTLALLTVPVVIVATEESLSAIPREVREGALALGATQWESIRRVLLPASLPGILTGMILAMARGAGEVAPLMITGVVKLAPTLPLDDRWPFLHLERKFMHLGFHIYDVGFQSPNVEAAKPMVFTTTLLLLGVVLGINLLAIWLRGRLRRRHQQAGV